MACTYPASRSEWAGPTYWSSEGTRGRRSHGAVTCPVVLVKIGCVIRVSRVSLEGDPQYSIVLAEIIFYMYSSMYLITDILVN